jgi:PAP2 superfamily protein
VSSSEAVQAVDHPVARFVAAHRAAALTSVMRAVSVVGGPAGMTALALAAGVLLGVMWRWWAPALVLAVTAAGIIGLTVVFKAALGRARPPLAQAVAAADGYGFPSGHAAAAAAVCGAAAWLCSLRMRLWRARVAVWAAAMLAALFGSLQRASGRALGQRRRRRLDLRGLVDGSRGERLGHLRPPHRPEAVTGARSPACRGRWPLRNSGAGATLPRGRSILEEAHSDGR